ncbi:MAG: phosphatase PAP2 family protein [Desulfuromonadales bacterium]
MNGKLLDFGLPLLVLLLGTMILAVTGADLALSTWFYRPEGWPVGNQFPWRQFYRWGYYPAELIGLISLGLLSASFFKPTLLRFRRQAAYMVVLLLVGPGLLVNALFKDHWGRPRPRQIVPFGGAMQFHQPWERGEAGKGKSFPSGHGGSAFYLAMPFFLLRRRKPHLAARVYAGGILYGVLMGVARISQGGHFASDILWSWGIVHLTAVACYYLMRPDQVDSPPLAD